MPYQAPTTIKAALDRIRKHDHVLPAVQREFVWKPDQIYRLFDSLMQGFPVGSFLFWKSEPEKSKNFEFFDFAGEYHQRGVRESLPIPAKKLPPIIIEKDGRGQRI